MANPETLKRLHSFIKGTTSSIPQLQEKAIETGDFSEIRRAQQTIKMLSGLADQALASPVDQEPPVTPAPVKPTPAPAPTPSPAPVDTISDLRSTPAPAPRGEGETTYGQPRRQPDGSLKDFIQIEIPNALDALGEITGRIAGEAGEQQQRPVIPKDQPGPGEGTPVDTGGRGIKAPAPDRPAPNVAPVSSASIYDLIPPSPSPTPVAPQRETWEGMVVQGPSKYDFGESSPSAPPTAPTQEPESPAPSAPNVMPTGGSIYDLMGDKNWRTPPPLPPEQIESMKMKATELGESPVSVLGSITQEANATPGFDMEKEFLSRVQMLGLDRKVPTWERFLTAMAYGAANIFSRWVSRNWRMPLNFSDLYSQDRRDEESRRQIALQLLSERAQDRRQQASLGAAEQRQNATHASREKIAQIKADGMAKRKTAQNDLQEASRYYDLLSKMDRVAAEPFEREIDTIVAQIKAADDKLRTLGVGTGIPGEYKYNPDDLAAHAKVVDPLNAQLATLKNKLAQTIQAIRTQNPR